MVNGGGKIWKSMDTKTKNSKVKFCNKSSVMVVNHNSTTCTGTQQWENYSDTVSLPYHLTDTVRPDFKGAHSFKPQKLFHICCV